MLRKEEYADVLLSPLRKEEVGKRFAEKGRGRLFCWVH